LFHIDSKAYLSTFRILYRIGKQVHQNLPYSHIIPI